MGKLANKIAYLKETIRRIRSAVATLTDDDYFNHSPLRNVAYALSDIYTRKSIWEAVTESGTDALGDFTIKGITNDGYDSKCVTHYFRVVDGVVARESAPIIFPHYCRVRNTSGSIADDFADAALDLRGLDTLRKSYAYSPNSNYYLIPYCRRLLLPENFSYENMCLSNVGCMVGGLYLSKTSSEYSSNWVMIGSDTEIPIKCPKDASVPYYLNKFTMSVDDMVAIFENMKDLSANASVKYITLGSTNLAKLAEEQKQIAYAKGWDLQ